MISLLTTATLHYDLFTPMHMENTLPQINVKERRQISDKMASLHGI